MSVQGGLGQHGRMVLPQPEKWRWPRRAGGSSTACSAGGPRPRLLRSLGPDSPGPMVVETLTQRPAEEAQPPSSYRAPRAKKPMAWMTASTNWAPKTNVVKLKGAVGSAISVLAGLAPRHNGPPERRLVSGDWSCWEHDDPGPAHGCRLCWTSQPAWLLAQPLVTSQSSPKGTGRATS